MALSLTSSLTSASDQRALNDQFRHLISSLDADTPASNPPALFGGSSSAGLRSSSDTGWPAMGGPASSTFGSTHIGSVSTAASSRPPSSCSSRSYSSHLELLDWGQDGDSEQQMLAADMISDRRLRRLQQMVRQRLRHKTHKSMPRAGGGAGGPLPFHKGGTRRSGERGSGGGGAGEVEAAAAQVQRIFRNRRQDSRRRAVLAIERFYLRRRRSPPLRQPSEGTAASGSPSKGSLAPLLESEIAISPEMATSGGGDQALHGGDAASASSAAQWPSPPLWSKQPHSPTGRSSREQPPIPAGQAALIRQAQAAFRARQLRKKAVRVIESAWSEWQYHSEQATIAARDAETAHFHAYHAERRERAARVIQCYLQRQQAQLGGDDVADDVSGGGGAMLMEGGEGSARDLPLYSSAELEMLRRVQRAFRAHVRSQAEEAEEVLHATRSAADCSFGADERLDGGSYARLCDILRRCSLEGQGASLSRDEQSVLVTLQHAVRDHLERKRTTHHHTDAHVSPSRGLPTVPSATAIDSMAGEEEGME